MFTTIKKVLSIVEGFIIIVATTVYSFVADHLKQIFYYVAAALIIAGTFLIIRDPAQRKNTVKMAEVAVRRHLRMLPEGYSHSPAKAAEAAKLGISLLDNQTIVDSYVKTITRRGN